MRPWRKAVPLAPVSSNTRFISAQAQSSVSHHVCIHKATLLESAMSLTNVQLTPPLTCGHASVARSTIRRRLLLSGSFHKNSVMFLSNRHSARDGAGAAESTSSTVGRIMVHIMGTHTTTCLAITLLTYPMTRACFVSHFATAQHPLCLKKSKFQLHFNSPQFHSEFNQHEFRVNSILFSRFLLF